MLQQKPVNTFGTAEISNSANLFSCLASQKMSTYTPVIQHFYYIKMVGFIFWR